MSSSALRGEAVNEERQDERRPQQAGIGAAAWGGVVCRILCKGADIDE
jgi:hypothetical protein